MMNENDGEIKNLLKVIEELQNKLGDIIEDRDKLLEELDDLKHDIRTIGNDLIHLG